MEFFKPGRVYDFMGLRKVTAVTSVTLTIASLVLFFTVGPKLGIDFAGGTEVQLQFRGDVPIAELRQVVEELGFRSPDVIAIAGHPNQYLIRVNEVTSLPPDIEATIHERLDAALDVGITTIRVSGGGDKVSIRLEDDADPSTIRDALAAAGLDVRGEVRRFGPESDHRFEADLIGVADHLVAQLDERLGDRGPEPALRTEWVGPRAGAQLQLSAIKALIYALGFIMLYVAFRFDLRFAPGGVVGLLHDVIVTVGFFIVLGKEFNITTIASLLTIVGYSINDTIVVYDRIRENMARHREMDLWAIINLSTSEMLGRTMMTSLTTVLAIIPFFIWGTQVIFDISLAIAFGIVIGTYSSVYIAAPFTHFMDEKIFKPVREARRQELLAQRKLKKAAAR